MKYNVVPLAPMEAPSLVWISRIFPYYSDYIKKNAMKFLSIQADNLDRLKYKEIQVSM
jgi:hypothetical protein